MALAAPLGAALAGAVRAGLQEARGRAGSSDWTEGAGAWADGRERRTWGRDGAVWGGARGTRVWVDGGEPVDGDDGGAWADGGASAGGTAGVGSGDAHAHGRGHDHGHRHGRMDAGGRGGAHGGPGRWGDGTVLLVPVPSARRAVRARGHDPARRIALAAAGELRRSGTPARVLAVLRQGRRVADQAGLNSRQRLENLAGALEVAPGAGRLLDEGPVVLVDDLMTTGASLAEAARAVRAGRDHGTVGSQGAFARAVSVGAGEREEVARTVYAAVSRESREERMTGVMEEETAAVPRRPGMAGVGTAHDVICAAVVAASPDSFEINRN